MKRKVYVYNNHWERADRCLNRPLAYVTWQTAGACVHEVEAKDRLEALSIALREHKSCDQSDRHCHGCKVREAADE